MGPKTVIMVCKELIRCFRGCEMGQNTVIVVWLEEGIR